MECEAEPTPTGANHALAFSTFVIAASHRPSPVQSMTSVVLFLAALAWQTQGTISRTTAPTAAEDTVVKAVADSTPVRHSPGDSTAVLDSRGQILVGTLDDTVRRRPRAVEVSDAYALRLRIHRYASYTMIPLFAVQSVAGNQLFQADQSGAPRPGWAKTTHSAGAAGLGALFTLNTVTGVWNLWESRDNEVGRTKRWIHSALLLGSDAGFAWSGIKLASDAKNSQSSREQHRRVSFISMGAALAGYAVMLVGEH
jgi:hypothetical protein